MKVRMNGVAIISFLLVLLCSRNSVFAQFRLDIREVAGNQDVQEDTDTGSEQLANDLNDVFGLRGGGQLHDQWSGARERYRRQLGKLLEDRQQNERLSAEEFLKLWLAGVGDIEKFMQPQELKGEVRMINDNQLVVFRGNNIHFARAHGPLFGAGSMVALVSKRLSSGDPEILEHRRQVAVAAEELLLTDLESVMPLTAKQHKAVLDLLKKHRPVVRYAHFRKHYVEAMDCLLEHSQELGDEFNPQQLKSFGRIVGNTQNAVGKLSIPDL